MTRLIKTTAAAMLLTLMTAAPALAIYDPSAPTTHEPGVIRILKAPAEIQKPLVQDGTLMVPLRATVEGAGGTVAWDGETRTVTVRLGDRTAWIVIGTAEAEMVQDNVRYVRRNMIRMAKAPVLVGGRTLVAADALTGVLGLQEPAPPAAAPAEEQDWVVGGMLKEIKHNFDGATSILVEGAPMANGEGSLTWFVLSDSTKITVTENGVEREGSQHDLAAAQALKVDVRPTGPLLMSYPAQGGAAAILIYK